MMIVMTIRPTLIIRKNENNFQYFCAICNIMLAEVEDNKIKNFQSCIHFRIEKFGKEYYFRKFIRPRKIIAEEKDYFYLLIPNDND